MGSSDVVEIDLPLPLISGVGDGPRASEVAGRGSTMVELGCGIKDKFDKKVYIGNAVCNKCLSVNKAYEAK